MNPESKEKSKVLLFALRLEVVMWEDEEVGVVGWARTGRYSSSTYE